jgi:hypothetical protein
MFYGNFEIKLPSFVPNDYEVDKDSFDPEKIEELHNQNMEREEKDLGDSKEIMDEFIDCLKKHPDKAYTYKYKSGLAYIYYEELLEKKRSEYIKALEGESDFISVLYNVIGI